MRNERTPRTLADSQFTTGYAIARQPRRQSAASYLLAVAIGMALAYALIYGGK